MSMSQNNIPTLQPHQLEKFRNEQDNALVWRCPVCRQSWAAQPSRPCPSVPVYPHGQRPQHLKTRNELALAHLIPTGPVVGATEAGSAKARVWEWLYDKAQTKLAPLPKAVIHRHSPNTLYVDFPVQPALVAQIKKLPGSYFNWKEKYWIVPAAQEELLRGLVRQYFVIEGEEDTLPASMRPVAQIRQVVVEAQAALVPKGATVRQAKASAKTKAGADGENNPDAASTEGNIPAPTLATTFPGIGNTPTHNFVWATVAIDGCFLVWPRNGEVNTTTNGGFEVLDWTGSYLEGQGHYDEPFKVRYVITVRTRVGAEWEVRSRFKNSKAVKASYQFIGEAAFDHSQLAGSPAEFDIELGEADEALPLLPGAEYAIELEVRSQG